MHLWLVDMYLIPCAVYPPPLEIIYPSITPFAITTVSFPITHNELFFLIELPMPFHIILYTFKGNFVVPLPS